MINKKKQKSIYKEYRRILRNPNLSDEEIDKMRIYVRLLALTIVEHSLKAKVNQIL